MNKREMVAFKTNDCCAYCGEELFSEKVIDHIIPKCYGGSNDIENLFLSCVDCNISKGSMNIEEFRDYLQNLETVLSVKFVKYRLLLKYQKIKTLPIRIKFYFEEKGLSGNGKTK